VNIEALRHYAARGDESYRRAAFESGLGVVSEDAIIIGNRHYFTQHPRDEPDNLYSFSIPGTDQVMTGVEVERGRGLFAPLSRHELEVVRYGRASSYL